MWGGKVLVSIVRATLGSAWSGGAGAGRAESVARPAGGKRGGVEEADAALDRAVWAVYGWEDDPGQTGDEAILARLLALNGARAGAS
jgi:hypothetical protein